MVGSPAPAVYATNIPIYKADIQALDTEIGRLLAEVDLETTTVIFIGDNGVPPPVTDAGQGIRGAKWSVYEGGVRVPLVVAGAGDEAIRVLETTREKRPNDANALQALAGYLRDAGQNERAAQVRHQLETLLRE